MMSKKLIMLVLLVTKLVVLAKVKVLLIKQMEHKITEVKMIQQNV